MDKSSSERIKVLFTSWESHINNNVALIDRESILYVPRSHFAQEYRYDAHKLNLTSTKKSSAIAPSHVCFYIQLFVM